MVVMLEILLGVGSVAAQEAGPVLGGQPAVEIGRVGAAAVLEAVGPPLFGRREFYRPVPPLPLRNRWIVVQDSTSGIVFTEASGVRPDLDNYDGDLYLRALTDVKAIEVRALVFNVWGELSAYLGMTVLVERSNGERWDLHPRWEAHDAPTGEHRTTISWVNRVMFSDESILEADIEPLEVAWTHVTGSAFEGLPEELLVRAIGP